MAEPEQRDRKPLPMQYVDLVERGIYYVAAVFLLGAVFLLFLSTVQAFLKFGETGPLNTALTVLNQILLIFIFAELLNTIGIIIRESEIVAEPFILIGLIAVVRRILAVTVDIEQSLDNTTDFRNLVLELGVLTALVVALAGALYFTRRANPARDRPSERSGA